MGNALQYYFNRMTNLDSWYAIRNNYQSETLNCNVEDELENLLLTYFEHSNVSEAQALQELEKKLRRSFCNAPRNVTTKHTRENNFSA